MALNSLGKVEKWKNQQSEPLDDESELVYWMAKKVAEDGEIYHREAMSHIKSKYGENSRFLTENGIQSYIITLVENALGGGLYWNNADQYTNRKWERTEEF